MSGSGFERLLSSVYHVNKLKTHLVVSSDLAELILLCDEFSLIIRNLVLLYCILNSS